MSTAKAVQTQHSVIQRPHGQLELSVDDLRGTLARNFSAHSTEVNEMSGSMQELCSCTRGGVAAVREELAANATMAKDALSKVNEVERVRHQNHLELDGNLTALSASMRTSHDEHSSNCRSERRALGTRLNCCQHEGTARVAD